MIARATLPAVAALGAVLAGCASSDAAAPSRASYTLGRGVVSYDELRRASEKCTSEGGKIEAKQDGGDPAQLANYTCVIPRGGK